MKKLLRMPLFAVKMACKVVSTALKGGNLEVKANPITGEYHVEYRKEW